MEVQSGHHSPPGFGESYLESKRIGLKRTLLTCPRQENLRGKGRKSRLGSSALVGQVPGLDTLQAQAFTDSSMWAQAMGPTVLQKSQQVPTTGSPVAK